MKRMIACVLLAACGADDADLDPPMPPGSVSVRVTNAGVPQVNVEVFFQEADGAVKSVTVTDVDGLAIGEVSGGFVTVIEPRGASGRDTLSTFTGVQTNDALHLELAALIDEAPVTVMMQIEVDPAASSHQVKTTCGEALGFGTTQPEQVTLLGCGDEADMLVISGDGEGTLLRSQLHRGLRLDETVTLTGTYVDFLARQVTYTNLPSGVTFVGAYRRYLTARGPVFDGSTGADLAGATAASTIRMPEITPASGDVIMTSSAPYPALDSIGEQVIIEWSPASTSDYSLDVGDATLASYTAAPTYDPATHLASWSLGTGQAPNFVRASVAAYRDDIPEGRAWSWRIAGAHEGSELAFPELPLARDGFDFNLQGGDTASVDVLTTAKLPVGYGELATRAHAFGDLKTQITGPSGQLVIQELFDPE